MPVSFVLASVFPLPFDPTAPAVGQALAEVRARAQADGVTGLMVFDGAGFCLYLEGEEAAVARCHEASARYARHPRQAGNEAICFGQRPTRRYAGFFTGHARAGGVPVGDQLRALDGPGALRRFLEMAEAFALDQPADR